MNPYKCKGLGKMLVTVALIFVWGVCVLPGLAGEGDSPLEAYHLPYGTEVGGVIGADYLSDNYKVIVPATGRLIVRLYDIHLNASNEQLHLWLFRRTENSVGTGYFPYDTYVAASQNGYTTPDVIDIPDLARGIYFLKVSPHAHLAWDGGDYKIKAEFSVFPPVVKDDIGDQKRYALPVLNQLPTIGRLDTNHDVDYFECHIPDNTDLTLSLTGISSNVNVDMEVTTAWDVVVGTTAQTGTGDKQFYLPDLLAGQYFIKVFGQGITQYTFTATSEFTEATDIRDDVGDDLAHAMPLLAGNPSVFCLQNFGADTDVFSIYQPEDGPLSVDVYNQFMWASNEDLYVDILDEYGQIIAQSNNGRLIPEHIEVFLVRGQYFVSVHSQAHLAWDGGIYTINVETAGDDVGDAFNKAMQIHAIPYGFETYGYPYIGMIDRPGDVDFFQVVLKDTGFIYLEVDRMLYGNVDVQLFDAYYNLLQTSANSELQPEVVYVDDLPAGIYFIKVSAAQGEVGQYRLIPTISTPTSPIGDDIGDSIERAFPLVPYRYVNAYFWNDSTDDYYSFQLDRSNDQVCVRVDQQHLWAGNEDIRLFVYNSAGDQIGLSDTPHLKDEIVCLPQLEAGTYFVRVDPEGHLAMDPVQYRIVVETDAAPLPSAMLQLPADIQGTPGVILDVPVFMTNDSPVELTHLSLGVQFDPNVLEPQGVTNAGLTLSQWNAQVRYTRSENTLSVSMDNFAAITSGTLLHLVFRIQAHAPVGSISDLTLSIPALNGALVPGTDGAVTVVDGSN
ncbi:cohesin domain-containing protein [Planctomycetota bacterium]